MINRLFEQGIKANIFPPPPPELEGQPLKIRFISTLAMAQRAVVTSDIERLTTFASTLVASGWSGAVDKYDADQAMDEYARATGVPPKVIVSDERVAQIREARIATQQAAEALEGANSLANTAKTASEVDSENLNEVIDGEQ
jgi:hypothetical protein